MRTCTKCGETKPDSEFYLRYGKPRNRCKDCSAKQWQEWRARESETYEEYRQARRQRRLLEKYNITVEDWQDMWDEQFGCCLICESEFDNSPLGRACVDHNHDTMEVRGLLCVKCNRGLGNLGDSEKLVDRALRYLRGEL